MNDLQFERRAKVFALHVMKLDETLPQNSVGRPIGSQLIRGTSIVLLKVFFDATDRVLNPSFREGSSAARGRALARASPTRLNETFSRG